MMDEASVRAAAASVAFGYGESPVDATPSSDPVSRMHESLKQAESDIAQIAAAEFNGDVMQGTADMVRAELDQALAPAAARVSSILRETGRVLASVSAKRRRTGGTGAWHVP
jgi:hypothetical protein